MSIIGETMELITELKLQKDEFQRDLLESKHKVASFVEFAGAALATIGAGFVLHGVKEAFSDATKEVELLYQATRKIGISIADFQALNFSAEKFGVTTQQVTTSLQLMQRGIGEAKLRDDSLPAIALKLLNVELSELNGLNPEQQFLKIASAAGQMSDKTLEATAINALFGRGARQALAWINSDVPKALKEFQTFGSGISEAQGEQNHAFTESKAVLNVMWEGFIGQVTSDVLPLITKINKGLEETIKQSGGIRTIAKKTSDVIIEGWNAAKYAVDDYNAALKLIGDKASAPFGKNFDSGMRDPNGRDIIAHPINTILGGIADIPKAFEGLYEGLKEIRKQDDIAKGGSYLPSITDLPQQSYIDAGQKLFTASSEASDSLEELSRVVKKVKENSFTKDLDSQQNSAIAEQRKRIEAKLDVPETAKSDAFDSAAANILQIIRNSDPRALQDSALRSALDRNLVDLYGAATVGDGKDHTAQLAAYKDLNKLLDSKSETFKQPKWELGITIKGIPDNTLQWTATGEHISVIDGRIQAFTSAQAQGANS